MFLIIFKYRIKREKTDYDSFEALEYPMYIKDAMTTDTQDSTIWT